jgi:nicotinamide riboside kinase
MSEIENHSAPSDENHRDESHTAQDPEPVGPEASADPGKKQEWLESVEPKLPGPEIPNAVVNECGVFTVRVGDTEVLETARVEFGMGLGLDREKPIEWLWPERIPLGMLTVVEGGTETGKSLIAADMAARVTRGAPWPGRDAEPNRPGEVLYLSGDLEDWDSMILPRLMRAGANVRRVAHVLDIDTCDTLVESRATPRTYRPLRFPEDLPHLEFRLRAHPDMRLVVVDSLATLCPNAKAHQETLRQLNEIAVRRNVAIVVASRPARQPARNKLVPAVDKRSDAVRCVFNTLRDLEDEELRYLAPARMSFAAKPQWLPYRIGAQGIVWEAPIDAPPEASGISEAMREKRALRDDAIEWLRGELKDGPLAQKRVVREAKQYGFSYATLRRAKSELGLRSKRIEFGAGISYWAWVLEPEGAEGGEGVEGAANASPAPVSDVSTYGKSAEKSAAERTTRGSNGNGAQSPEELLEHLEKLGAELDAATLSEMMTPAAVMRILKASYGLYGDETPVRSRPKGRNGRNGRHTSNGHHGSNGRGRKPK